MLNSTPKDLQTAYERIFMLIYSHLSNKRTGWNKQVYINEKVSPCSFDKVKKCEQGHCVLKWVLRGPFLGIKMPQ